MTNFWEALELIEVHKESEKKERRLYYDENGDPICYTYDDLPELYIVVDADTFAQVRMDIKIVDGEIKQGSSKNLTKLVPSDKETTPIHPQDVSIIVDNEYKTPRYWRVKTTKVY